MPTKLGINQRQDYNLYKQDYSQYNDLPTEEENKTHEIAMQSIIPVSCTAIYHDDHTVSVTMIIDNSVTVCFITLAMWF